MFKYGTWYIVNAVMPRPNGKGTDDRSRRIDVGMFEGQISKYHEDQYLFRFPHLQGKLHDGNSRRFTYPKHDVWWIFGDEVVSELKQGKKL